MAIKKSTVDVPFGSASVVKAAAKLAARHVVSDITEMVFKYLRGRVPEMAKIFDHQGVVCPSSKFGLLDFSVEGESLKELTIDLTVVRFRGGNGEPVEAAFDEAPLARLQLHLDPSDGRLVVSRSVGETEGWSAFVAGAGPWLCKVWLHSLDEGLARRITSADGGRREIESWLRAVWSTEKLDALAGASGVCAFDEEEEVNPHLSTVDMQAMKVYVVTPELAARLAEIGENAGTMAGLPYWSTDLMFAPEATQALQRLAFNEMNHPTTSLSQES